MYWRKRDVAKAREHLGRAVELNSHSWKTYWDFARLAQDAPPEDRLVITALDKAISMNPQLTDARLILGYRYYASKQFGLALATLRQIKQITPEFAPRLFLLIAHSSLQLKDTAEARKAALQAKQYAKDSADISSVDEIIAHLDQPARNAAANDIPKLARSGVSGPEPREELSRIEGILTEIECADASATLHVASGNKNLAFLIRDSARVYIKGGSQGEQLLPCGKTHKPITLEFLPMDDRATGTVGEARIIVYTDKVYTDK
jgi:tetratricopeptide (TPR) repeat protein